MYVTRRTQKIEAHRLQWDNIRGLAVWCSGKVSADRLIRFSNGLIPVTATIGDWLVKENDRFCAYSNAEFNRQFVQEV